MEKCVICGNDFYPEIYGQETCSKVCEIQKNNMSEKRKEKKCPVCGKNFITYDHRKKYCSEECRIIKRKETVKRSREKNKKPKEGKKECIVCGKSFTPNSPTQIYCSSDCRKEQNRKNKKIKPINKTCIVCGKVFSAKHFSAKMCSDKCKKIRQKEQQRKYNENYDKQYSIHKIRNIDIGSTKKLEYIIRWDSSKSTEKSNYKYEAVTRIGLFKRLGQERLTNDLYYRWNLGEKLDRLKQIKDSTLNDKELNYYYTTDAIEIFEMIEELGGGN